MEEKIDVKKYEDLLNELLPVSKEDIFNCGKRVNFERFVKKEDSDDEHTSVCPNLDKQEKGKFPCPTNYEEEELFDFMSF